MTHVPPAPPALAVPLAHPLLAMMLSAAQSQLLRVAAELGIADLVREGPKTVAELAAATGTQVAALARIMRALTALELVAETAPQQYTCTPLGTLLQADSPASLRGYALLFGSPLLFQLWPQLLHSVHTGTSGFAHLLGPRCMRISRTIRPRRRCSMRP
ncbi:MAG: methyltransferase dimerization domain-containing protein [Candidatus Tectimicrobiota bacterium]